MAPASIPPPLPPTVEEAYRRKCVQLKHRTKEVSNANDAAHLRLNRMKRQVEKMRLERAFLLEQLARRTSTNVEDSEGSPSPPPTPEPQPKDKPLRTKRNHRKGSLLPGTSTIETPPPAGAAAAAATTTGLAAPSGLLTAQNLRANAGALSPSGSDAAAPSSHAGGERAKSANGTAAGSATGGAAITTATANGKQSREGGGASAARKPFDFYADERRPSLLRKAIAANGDDDEDEDESATAARVEEDLAKEWKNLSDEERAPYEERAEGSSPSKQPVPAAAGKTATAAAAAADDATTPAGATQQDEDVEMGNYDTDDQETETQGEKADE